MTSYSGFNPSHDSPELSSCLSWAPSCAQDCTCVPVSSSDSFPYVLIIQWSSIRTHLTWTISSIWFGWTLSSLKIFFTFLLTPQTLDFPSVFISVVSYSTLLATTYFSVNFSISRARPLMATNVVHTLMFPKCALTHLFLNFKYIYPSYPVSCQQASQTSHIQHWVSDIMLPLTCFSNSLRHLSKWQLHSCSCSGQGLILLCYILYSII